jgi:hypothetical protein
MDSQPTPASPDEPTEIPAAFGPAPRKGMPRGVRVALASTAAVLVVGVTAGAYSVGSYLSGGGTQPDDVLRSGALAFAKLDLDPAASQKVAIWQLSKKFPDLLKAANEDTALKDSLGAGLLTDSGLSYEQDVKPWLGSRIGVAAYAPAAAGQAPQIAVAIQYTDEAKMTAALEKMDDAEDIGWTTREGYVVLSETKAAAESLTSPNTAQSLGEQRDYAADVEGLDGSQIAVAWADLGGIVSAAQAAMPPEFADMALPSLSGPLPGGPTSGRFAVGLHASGDFLEVQGKTYGAEGASAGQTPGTNLAGRLPAETIGAVSATGLTKAVTEQWEQLESVLGGEFADEMLGGLGLTLPADFGALLGTETALGVTAADSNSPAFTVRALGGDFARAEQLVAKLVELMNSGIPAVHKTADGYVMGNDPAVAAKAAEGAPSLADTERFKRAAPDADRAGFVLFADLGKIVDMSVAEDPEAAKAEALDAVGFTATAEENPTFRLRLTTR